MPLIDILKNKIVKRTALPLTLAGTLLVGCGKDHGPEQKPEPIIAENTKILDNSILQNISSYKEGTFTFSDSTYVAHNLSEGDIMVGGVSDNTPHGFLRKIESISQDKKIIRTTQASLEEAIEYCDIEERGTLHPPRSNRFKSTVEPTDFNFIIPLENIILYDLDGNDSTTYDQIIADGRVSFNYDYVFRLKIDKNNLGLEKFVFNNVLNEDTRVSIDAKITKNINVNKNVTELILPPLVIYIPTTPPFPIIIVPEIEVNMGANGEISLGSYFNVSQNMRLEAGIVYENHEWNLIKSLENEFDFNYHGLEANALIKAYAGPELVFYLYGIAGASAEINATSKLDVDLLREPSLRLYGGLEAKVGAEAEILGRNILDYEATVFDNMELLYESSDSLPPVSPTGKIAYNKSDSKIYMLTFPTLEEEILEEGASDPALNHEGNKIAYNKSGDIWIEEINGNKMILVRGAGLYFNDQPRWSPNDEKIVYHRFELNNWNQETRDKICISNGNCLDTNSFYPEWISNNKIVYVKFIPYSGFHIKEKDLDNGETKVVIEHASYPRYNKTKEKIAFISDIDRNGIVSIYTSNLDGTNIREIVEFPNPMNGSQRFDWSPDGNYIAFTKERDLYITDSTRGEDSYLLKLKEDVWGTLSWAN